MEDIIFQEQNIETLRIMQVQLKLDNKARKLQVDSDDIVVTRRLYRSGESEYYLNNDKARLRISLNYSWILV